MIPFSSHLSWPPDVQAFPAESPVTEEQSQAFPAMLAQIPDP